MALPTVEKTWQYNVNTLCGGLGTSLACSQDALFKIKQALIGFGTLPWTVWGSCDGTGGAGSFGNNDSVDRWIDYGDIIWSTSTSPRSWIVLKQSGLGTNTSICLYPWTSGQSWIIDIVLFPTGCLSNGTANSRPTATNEVSLLNPSGTGNWGVLNGIWSGRIHAMQSTDGKVTRIIICRGNYTTGFTTIESVKDPVSPWTVPVIGASHGVDTSPATVSVSTYTNFYHLSTHCFGRLESVNAGFYMSSEGFNAGAIGEYSSVVDDDTAEWPICPVILSSATPGARGFAKGILTDIWWGSTTPANGDCYPNDGSKQLAQFGTLIVPWNGTTPLVA